MSLVSIIVPVYNVEPYIETCIQNNPCLKEWRSYLDLQYPDWKENPYIRQLSGKDKILLLLLRHRCYAGMCMLSVLRKGMDRLKNK